ncbi:ADYC domain-containing protein [Vitiosangium sp. GDMCC 1.1324]|uniref:ADYC domain-containing protein n=1 Tax=Vitiosangium sp. (strain GDMCC 1.1324) TaxID=2138576 RepID=UPI0011B81629|nr:ADYC domain-containing protein [Vitiosangium sp. GDMCC 1.1324]
MLFTVLVLGAGTGRAELSEEGHQGQQGTRVYATLNDRFEHADIPMDSAQYAYRPLLLATPTQVPFLASLDRGQLKGKLLGEVPAPLLGKVLAGADFTQVSFVVYKKGLEPVTYQIVRAREHTNVYPPYARSTTLWQYQVRWSSGRASGDVCPGGTNGWALALPGGWNQGQNHSRTTVFSFACLPIQNSDGTYTGGGVAAKCVDWGYSPWNTGKFSSDLEASSYHTACVTMATADYCGEGKTNTVNGTPIIMFDAQNVQTQPSGTPSQDPRVSPGPFGPDRKYLFEAAWALDATNSDLRSMRARAVCLSKKRWSTMPLGGSCASTLVDPRRTGLPLPPLTYVPPVGRYCEDMSMAELNARGAVLFSYSQYIDAGLYRFRKPTGDGTYQYLTTAHVGIEAVQGSYIHTYSPAVPGLSEAEAAQYQLDVNTVTEAWTGTAFEGPVLSPKVSCTDVVRLGARKLLRYKNGDTGAFVTLVPQEGEQVEIGPGGSTLDEPEAGNDCAAVCPQQCASLEGYVYGGSLGGNFQPLQLWSDTSTGGYVTTTGNPPAGFNEVASDLMGYLPALSDYAAMP